MGAIQLTKRMQILYDIAKFHEFPLRARLHGGGGPQEDEVYNLSF